jgi:hypothetical protein
VGKILSPESPQGYERFAGSANPLIFLSGPGGDRTPDLMTASLTSLPYCSLRRATLTIATIPAFTASGRLSHMSITLRRSSGRSDIHMTCSERKNVLCWCSMCCAGVRKQAKEPHKCQFLWDLCAGCAWRVDLRGCRRGDLNPHALSGTTPSRWRVYQFHHFGMQEP